MSKRIIKAIASLLSASIIFASGIFGNMNIVNAADIPVNTNVFPDKEFCDYVYKYIDSDKNYLLSQTEIANTKDIRIMYSNSISSLEGIENFTSLKTLVCYSNNLTRFNPSQNPSLETIEFSGCQLGTLDVSLNTNLKNLYIANSNIRNFDVSKNTQLESLGLIYNNLTAIDVSKNTKLKTLELMGNQLTNIDISKNTQLEFLDVSLNRLTKLDVSKNVELWYLSCGVNNLSYLDVSNNPNLCRLECYDCFITSIGIKNNSYLIDVYNNPTGKYDSPRASYFNFNEEKYSNCVKTYFASWQNGIIMCRNGLILDLYCEIYTDKTVSNTTPAPNTRIPINVENFPDSDMRSYLSRYVTVFRTNELSYSAIYKTKELDFSGFYDEISDLSSIKYFTELEKLNVGYSNSLTELDLSNNHKLTELSGRLSAIKKVNLSGCERLTKLRQFVNGDLEEINLSGCTGIVDLCIAYNSLKELDISDCINLKYLQCHSNNLTSLDLSNCPDLIYLSCDGNNLTSIDLSKCKNLEDVDCGGNKLTELDLSQNTQLESVGFFSNQIKDIDLSNNPNLISLWCGGNPLSTLDITKNPLLERISLHETDIKELNIYYNEVLIDLYNNGYYYDAYITGSPRISMHRYTDSGNYLREDYIDYDEGLRFVIEPTSIPTATPTVITTQVPTATPTSTPTEVPTVNPTSGPVPTSVPTKAPSKSVGDFVNRCYSVALGRLADEEGYKYWCDSLNNGEACGAQVGYGFIFSAEYINKERSDEEFVTDLYSMYFDRIPDNDGFDYWVGMLKNGASREKVFAGFANSLEFYNLCSDYGVVQGIYLEGVLNSQQGGVNCFVARLYKVCLNRLPDMEGQGGWVLKLMNGSVSGTTCSYGFVFSPEFIGKEPSNEEFVAYMYRAFFGREADEAGFNAWVEALNSGSSYEEVFAGFSGSAEFANLCANYGIIA